MDRVERRPCNARLLAVGRTCSHVIGLSFDGGCKGRENLDPHPSSMSQSLKHLKV
jgi:hypothetical protein